MQKDKISLRHAFTSSLRAAKELNRISPQIFPVIILYSLVFAVLPYATVFFSAQILKELAVLRREEILWKWVISGVFCIGVLSLLKASLEQRYGTLWDDLWGRKEILFARKMFSIDYADMDKQETHDLRAQIRQLENWGGWGLARIPEICQVVLRNMIGILSGSALTVSLFTCPVPETAGRLTLLNNPIFALVLAGIMIAVSLLAGRFSAKALEYWHKCADEATFGNRMYSYFMMFGLKKERAADVRMYNQQDLISAYWDKDSSYSTDGFMGKMARGPLGIYGGLGVAVSALTTGFIYMFTCLKAWGGAFDVGSITQYVGAATALSVNIAGLMEMLGEMKTNTFYVDQAFQFLDIPNSMYQGSLTTEKRADRQYDVEFRNVSFKYPGSENWALRNVSMKFKVGKRLAIVGENGSGKTTFIKLLCRLYDPQEGQILLNGIDIRKYNYRDYMDVFSIVFQDFQLISQPLGCNVAGNSTYDEAKVRKALTDGGLGDRLEHMPDGLNTYLYIEYSEDGVEISGGEAQKIAIARALYKDAPFIILDEPTAALDPIAEAEIYSKFNDISGDKTAIYISHRLSSCKFCDEIAVFHNGAVIQQGTHDELVADENGKYHELWNAQAQYYIEKTA